MRTHQAVPEAPGLSCTDPHLAEVILDAAVPRRPLDAHVQPGAEGVLLVQEVEGEDAPRVLGVILAAARRREELGAAAARDLGYADVPGARRVLHVEVKSQESQQVLFVWEKVLLIPKRTGDMDVEMSWIGQIFGV